MTDRPNLYHLMLGVPEDVTSPNAYEILRLDWFEQREARIRDAAIDANCELLKWQNSDYHVECDQLIDKVVAARALLLDTDRKSKYDRRLRRRSGLLSEPSDASALRTAEEQPHPSPGEKPESNPYHLMLGLPKDVENPDFYELLGLERFADDIATVSHAADTAEERLRSWWHTGFHTTAFAIRNEISEARATLTDSSRKADHDRVLREELGLAAQEDTNSSYDKAFLSCVLGSAAALLLLLLAIDLWGIATVGTIFSIVAGVALLSTVVVTSLVSIGILTTKRVQASATLREYELWVERNKPISNEPAAEPLEPVADAFEPATEPVEPAASPLKAAIADAEAAFEAIVGHAVANTSAAQSTDTIVYVTRNGSKYHRAGCSSLRTSMIAMTRDEATRRYTPCSRCNPDW